MVLSVGFAGGGRGEWLELARSNPSHWFCQGILNFHYVTTSLGDAPRAVSFGGVLDSLASRDFECLEDVRCVVTGPLADSVLDCCTSWTMALASSYPTAVARHAFRNPHTHGSVLAVDPSPPGLNRFSREIILTISGSRNLGRFRSPRSLWGRSRPG